MCCSLMSPNGQGYVQLKLINRYSAMFVYASAASNNNELIVLACSQNETLLNTQYYDSVTNIKFVILQNL